MGKKGFGSQNDFAKLSKSQKSFLDDCNVTGQKIFKVNLKKGRGQKAGGQNTLGVNKRGEL